MSRWKMLLLLPLLAGGCVTHKLWTESALDSWNEPAPALGLQLFRDPPHRRVLVVYGEYSERREKIRERAYFVDEDQKPAANPFTPKFVNPKISRNLAPVAVFPELPTNPPEAFFAVADTNSPGFMLCSGNVKTGPYPLPVYDDGTGRLKRIALTPVAATIDLTIVGGAAGVLWLYAEGPGLGGSR
jgi:hypothetical protein